MTKEEAIRIISGEVLGTTEQTHEAVAMAVEALSAQSQQVTGKLNSDCISRRDAIDALYKMLHDCFWADDEELDAVITTLNELPSAQPERTCVNCGRTANNGGWYADGGTRCPIEEHYALPKDGFCHLWEKRNVTDDDYPERRTDE